jgi:Flp pilus assembly protein TadG
VRAARGRRSQRGQALVEFAFGFVVLLILLTGLLDIARAFHYTIGLEGAARAGARHGAFYQTNIQQQPYLDDADIKSAVDAVLLGDGLNSSTLKTSANCLSPTDSNSWYNPPYDSSAYPTTNNTPYLYICYDTQNTKVGTLSSPPAPGNTTYTGDDLLVVVLDRYGLMGGLSSEYLRNGGSSMTSITLTAFQHFAVQG